jgi:hypothetical protein
MKNKESLSKNNKIFIMGIVFAEIALIFIVAYFFALEEIGGGWESLGAMPFFFAAIPLSITGILLGINFIINKKFSIFSIILIIFSIGTFPFLNTSFISSVIAPILIPMAQVRHNKNIQRSYSSYNKKQQLSYKKLSEKFKNTQKVLAIDEQYKVVVLQDGSIVQPYQVIGNKLDNFIEWAKINLLNQEVKFELPFSENTFYNYNDIRFTSCDVGTGSIIINIRKKYGFPEKESGFCSIIPVNIYWNNELINDKYKISEL